MDKFIAGQSEFTNQQKTSSPQRKDVLCAPFSEVMSPSGKTAAVVYEFTVSSSLLSQLKRAHTSSFCTDWCSLTPKQIRWNFLLIMNSQKAGHFAGCTFLVVATHIYSLLRVCWGFDTANVEGLKISQSEYRTVKPIFKKIEI